jgi:hypothetical protein
VGTWESQAHVSTPAAPGFCSVGRTRTAVARMLRGIGVGGARRCGPRRPAGSRSRRVDSTGCRTRSRDSCVTRIFYCIVQARSSRRIPGSGDGSTCRRSGGNGRDYRRAPCHPANIVGTGSVETVGRIRVAVAIPPLPNAHPRCPSRVVHKGPCRESTNTDR